MLVLAASRDNDGSERFPDVPAAVHTDKFRSLDEMLRRRGRNRETTHPERAHEHHEIRRRDITG